MMNETVHHIFTGIFSVCCFFSLRFHSSAHCHFWIQCEKIHRYSIFLLVFIAAAAFRFVRRSAVLYAITVPISLACICGIKTEIHIVYVSQCRNSNFAEDMMYYCLSAFIRLAVAGGFQLPQPKTPTITREKKTEPNQKLECIICGLCVVAAANCTVALLSLLSFSIARPNFATKHHHLAPSTLCGSVLAQVF